MIEQTAPPAYFGSLTIENVKCFKGEQTINLSEGNGKPALWTVILGNNNTGKTTLLRCLADLEPVVIAMPNKEHAINKEHACCPKIFNKDIQYDDLNYPLHYKIQCRFSNIKYDWFCSVDIPSIDSSSKKASPLPPETIGNAIIYGYGTSRRMGGTSLSEAENKDNTARGRSQSDLAEQLKWSILLSI